MAILQAKNVVKTYGEEAEEGSTFALNNISLSVEKGEFIAIMGPSGSGKTTLLNILSGLDKPTSGEVRMGELEVSKITGEALALFRRQQLGFVFQDFNLLDSLTVKENIILPMALEKKTALEMDKKVQSLAELFGISSILDKYPYKISGGQQQRTAVSRALVNDPSVILADEPTGNLDSASSTAIMECFARIVDEFSTTILLVTHDVFAASYSQQVIFIKDGMIHSKINREGNQQTFLNKIIQHLAIVGGKADDIQQDYLENGEERL